MATRLTQSSCQQDTADAREPVLTSSRYHGTNKEICVETRSTEYSRSKHVLIRPARMSTTAKFRRSDENPGNATNQPADSTTAPVKARRRINRILENGSQLSKEATEEEHMALLEPTENVHGEQTGIPVITVDEMSVSMQETHTLPDNHGVTGRQLSVTEETRWIKQPTGRFNQFRRASAVFLEEIIHQHKDNNKNVSTNQKRGTLRRRLSLSDLFHRKSSNRNGLEESLEDLDDTAGKDNLNEKICVWFAGTFEQTQGVERVNSVYQVNGTSLNGFFLSSFGRKGSGKGEFQDIKDVTILQGDRLLLTDLVLGRVNLCQKTERPLLIYSGTSFREPWACADLGNKQLAVTSRKDRCVTIFSIEGEILNSFGETFFKFPAGLAVDKEGQIIVCDAKAHRVSVHDTTGVLIRYIGNIDDPEQSFKTPRYACVLRTGEIVVSDSGNHKIKLFSSTGRFISSFGGFGSGAGQMKYPYGICANKRGDIFVADHYNNRITMFSRAGKFLRHLVTSEHGLRRPQALALGPDMKLYVSHGTMKANEILIFDLKSR